ARWAGACSGWRGRSGRCGRSCAVFPGPRPTVLNLWHFQRVATVGGGITRERRGAMSKASARTIAVGVVALLLLLTWGQAEAQIPAASAEVARVAGQVSVLPKGQRIWASATAVQLARARQSNFTISTPSGVAAVRGTIAVVAHNPRTGETIVFALPSPGQLAEAARVTYVSRNGQQVTIVGGEFTRQIGTG